MEGSYEVIGLSEDVPGIQPDAPLREWLHAALLNGLSAPGEASAVPSGPEGTSSKFLKNPRIGDLLIIFLTSFSANANYYYAKPVIEDKTV